MRDTKLVLENGSVYHGCGFGSRKTAIAELVFNTSMVGYQEIISDPAYYGQMILMTYPLIGNYGLTDEDYESNGIHISGMVVREYNDIPSNFRYTRTLDEVLRENEVAGIYGIDTRKLTAELRDRGEMKAMITSEDKPLDECLAEVRAFKCDEEPVRKVTGAKIRYARTRNPVYNAVVLDLGAVLSNIRKLNRAGCNVVVVPYGTPKEVIMRYKPDGLFVSGGPGKPDNLKEAVKLIKEVKGGMPVAGVGLGAEVIALAYGAKAYKMQSGHRGANIAVRNTVLNKIDITSQNHSYAIDADSLKGTGLTPTHFSLVDNVVEGFTDEENKVVGMMYDPETQTFADNGDYIYTIFASFMDKTGGKKNA